MNSAGYASTVMQFCQTPVTTYILTALEETMSAKDDSETVPWKRRRGKPRQRQKIMRSVLGMVTAEDGIAA